MAQRENDNPHGKSSDEREPRRSGDAQFSWEFGEGVRPASLSGQARPLGRRRRAQAAMLQDQQGGRPSGSEHRAGFSEGLDNSYRNRRASDSNIAELHDSLDRALREWWATGRLPALRLLSAGLEALEAGHRLEEAERTLLLRTSLVKGRGIMTALKHIGDDERIVVLLHEALTEWDPPLDASYLPAVAGFSDTPWYGALIGALRHTTATGRTPFMRQNAVAALYPLGYRPIVVDGGNGDRNFFGNGGVQVRRTVLAVLVLALTVFFVWWESPMVPAGMVVVPDGTYSRKVAGGTGELMLISVEQDGLLMDRYEVTNGDYRSCAAAGACQWPVSYASATRQNYFTGRDYDDYPVVHVTWANARDYCEWRGKRLPTESEWEIAAGGGATGEPLTFPWGQVFAPQWTNSAEAAKRDTVAKGTYRPAGDSWIDIADLAGNVAEWTASENSLAGQYIVKGGSFRSDKRGIAVQARQAVSSVAPADWLGFRCAQTRPTRGQ